MKSLLHRADLPHINPDWRVTECAGLPHCIENIRNIFNYFKQEFPINAPCKGEGGGRELGGGGSIH